MKFLKFYKNIAAKNATVANPRTTPCHPALVAGLQGVVRGDKVGSVGNSEMNVKTGFANHFLRHGSSTPR